MRFQKIEIEGARLIDLDKRSDERGYFARIWCSAELEQQGLVGRVVQINTGFSPRAGTLRGLHFQRPPYAEVKIARCLRGAVFDVAVDLRPGSPTFRRWQGFVLTPENGRALYVPEGCAHGYLTLADDSELMYTTTQPYVPEAAGGVRYDDAAFGIEWPAPITVVSDADRRWPDFVG